MKKIVLTTIVAAVISTAPLAQAGFTGAQSYNDKVEVGESIVNAPPAHVAGRAGIGSAAFGGVTQKVDFQGLANYSSTSNGIYTLGSAHGGTIGVFNFAKVGSGDVWFGEWAQNFSQGANNGDRAVYYVGDDSNTSMPSSGVATYDVKGVNHFSGNNHLTGTLTANFGTNKLTGNIVDNMLSLDLNATINPATAAFNGSATWQLMPSLVGTTQGHFFGANAAAIAGIVKFSNARYLDTAFGGTKN